MASEHVHILNDQELTEINRGRMESIDRRKRVIRRFDTGAIRDTDDGKLDYEGFLSPIVLRRYAAYMHKNRKMADGSLRTADNWQKGIPLDAYMSSAWRHFMDVWSLHRGGTAEVEMDEALCALMFNIMGYLFETLKENNGNEPG